MYNNIEQVIGKYALEVVEAGRSRGAYLYRTKDGVYLLKQVKMSADKAEFMYLLAEYLMEHSMVTDCVIKNSEGNAVTEDEEGLRYMLFTQVDGRETDTKSRDEIIRAAKHLAKLHKCLREFSGEVLENVIKYAESSEEVLKRHCRELKKVRNHIHGKRKKNEFERAFLEVYPMYYNQAKTALEEYWTFGSETTKHYLRHGDYTQHNVWQSKDSLAVINWEQVQVGTQIVDLGHFLRKMMEKYNWNIGLGMDMIQAYEQELPLEEDDWRQLYLILAFPEKYWKLANYYQNSAKAWLLGRNVEKLNRIVSQEENRECFLKLLKSFVYKTEKNVIIKRE